MAPREGYEDGNIAEKHIAETGATSWSTFTKRPISRCFSYHRKHTDDELQMDAPKFPTAKFLLMKHNCNQELIGSKLENEIVKLPCVRTNSRGFLTQFIDSTLNL